MLKLTGIDIENFRSIKEESISLNEIEGKDYFALFGINESGKSSFLKAINLINKDVTNDYRNNCFQEALLEDEPISIQCRFGMGKEFLDLLSKSIGLPEELIEEIKEAELFYALDVLSDNTTVDEEVWFEQSKELSKLFLCDIGSRDVFIKSDVEEKELEGRNVKELTLDLFNDTFANELYEIFSKKCPEIVFWEPKESYLIDKPVNVSALVTNPNASIPLRNMFYLAGFKGEKLETAVKLIGSDPLQARKISKMIAKATTEFINKVWSDHNITVDVSFNGTTCTVGIQDNDSDGLFNMAQRSDGFKHFISILISLSIENKENILKNTILLLDEPEQSLHPGGIKHLRDELLNIASNNTVILASHSPYMVDKKHLDRHFKVEKINGETKINQIDADDPFQEEVIYEALGTSIFEIIEKDIIFFEGKNDKKLFDLYTAKFKKKHKLPNVKTIGATGAPLLPKYAKFFDQKNIKSYFVVDSDNAGRQAKENVIKENHVLEGQSFELKEIHDIGKKNYTMDDLLPFEVISETVNDMFDNKITLTPTDQPIMDEIKKLKSAAKITDDKNMDILKKRLVNKVQEDFSSSLTQAQLEEKYSDFCAFCLTLMRKVSN